MASAREDDVMPAFEECLRHRPTDPGPGARNHGD